MEGREWTLGEVKTEIETESGCVHLLYCSSDGRLKADREGTTSATLANFLSVHWEDRGYLQLPARDSFPLHLQLHVCPSDLPLHLGGEDLPQYVL